MSAPAKLMTLSEAISRFVADADTVYVGGFGQGVPFAAGREIIRQNRRDLTLCRTGADIFFDLLVAAGCVRGVIFGWYGNPGIGLSHVLRRAVGAGTLEIEETSNFGLLLRLHAGALGVPFLPARTLTLGDVPTHSEAQASIDCPFTGERLAALPALVPDVALVHAQRADEAGNVQLWGVAGDTLEGAKAARRIVVTVEEIVEPDVIRADPDRTVLPANMVSAVCHVPFGAHPSYVTSHYGRDDEAYRAFDTVSRDADALSRFMAETITDCPDAAHYAARFVAPRLETLGRA